MSGRQFPKVETMLRDAADDITPTPKPNTTATTYTTPRDITRPAGRTSPAPRGRTG